ncbi:MAG TPA: FkbM family methyltransferase [Sphingomicrobium sp.]|nr:FkbM family methyltransferase [Sphingomicrobium sp.]
MRRIAGLRREIHRLLAPIIYRDGVAVVPPRVGPDWGERRFLRRLLKELRVDCVFDVGANEGQYASDLRLIGYRGTIISFEPSPRSFERLSQISDRDPYWHVFDFALGSEAGEAQFNRMKESVYDSLRQPTTEETRHHAQFNQVVERVTVRVERLDTPFPGLKRRFGFTRPFLKTDTQGFDLEVFRGAQSVHPELVGLQCELALKRLYKGAPLMTDVLPEYERGFVLAGLFAVNPREAEVDECNLFFERRN